MKQLFLDLDGVLANFDGYYASQFGAKPDRLSPAAMSQGDFDKKFWNNIEQHGSFYLNLPPMPDAMELWNGAKQLHPHPIILTGLPYSVKDVEWHKREWVRRHIGLDAQVICCMSKDKKHYGQPGDVLVDDWIKYRQHWVDMGGLFVLHTSATDSLAQLKELL